ncbi:MAG TPA: hypothetical protein VE029_01045 [Rhizobacter sp.]|nr:hypothetical protein [Rhizobacter sp.]
MALGWLTVLQNVPWADVIGNAPKVAEAAKKLWKATSKAEVPAPPTPAGPAVPSSDARAMAALASRLASLEAASADLHAQMMASSELIQALAEQNAQLVARIEANRVRVVWLTVATLVAAIASVAGLGLALMRHVG